MSDLSNLSNLSRLRLDAPLGADAEAAPAVPHSPVAPAAPAAPAAAPAPQQRRGPMAWLSEPDGRPRQRRYLLAAAVGSVLLWTLAVVAVTLWPRSYTVESSLIVPSSDPDARVDLKEVGQAYATTRSTYDSKSLDPRVNYREMIMSGTVLDAAAVAAGLKAGALSAPRIKLIDQSSVMELRNSASTPEAALAQAKALHKAFQDRVTALRMDEQAQREQAIEQAVENSRKKFTNAQSALLAFKVESQIVTDKQLDELALVSTGLQRRQIELGQKVAHDRATVGSLSEQLGVPPRIAGWTLTLQGDAVFLDHFKQFAASSSLLADQSHKWEDSHPKVREARGQRDSAMLAMTNRARAVLGANVGEADLKRMSMVLQDRSRDLLLRELVATGASAEAATAELKEIDQQRQKIARMLPKLARESAQLDELQRRVNFAEAVFTGGVGKTDVGHTNIYSSYPMAQTLVAPSLPLKPSAPRVPFVIAGAAAASVLLLVGLSLAWIRAKR